MVRGVENKQTEAPRGPSQAIVGTAAHFHKNTFYFGLNSRPFVSKLFCVILHPCVGRIWHGRLMIESEQAFRYIVPFQFLLCRNLTP